MDNFNTLARQRGKATALGLAVKVVLILALGAVAALFTTRAAKTGSDLGKTPVSSAYAREPQLVQKVPLSPTQTKSWDPAEYAPALEKLNF